MSELARLIANGLRLAQLRTNSEAERYAAAKSPIRYEPASDAANQYHHRYYYLHCIHDKPYWDVCNAGNCKRTRRDAERWLEDFAKRGFKIPDL